MCNALYIVYYFRIQNKMETLNIFSSSTADISLGTEDTPVSRLANTLSDPAIEEAMVARLSVREKEIINHK